MYTYIVPSRFATCRVANDRNRIAVVYSAFSRGSICLLASMKSARIVLFGLAALVSRRIYQVFNAQV
jgi:hypothetical protein